MRIIKKISLLMLALVLGTCTCLASCGPATPPDDDEPDTGATYTVTVIDNEGQTVSGVVLTISDRNTSSGNLTTDENGVASAKLALDTNARIKATVKSVPDGYELPSSTITLTDGTATITLQKVVNSGSTLTVKLVDEQGNDVAVAGVDIQLCQDVCNLPVSTDASGIAVINYQNVDGYQLKIAIANSQECGYEIVNLESDGYVHFAEGTESVEIVVRQI